MGTSLIAALCIAILSLIGVILFRTSGKSLGGLTLTVPIAVGVFLSLIFIELIPETLASSGVYGGTVIVFGFITFYVLANVLHTRYHHLEEEGCERKGAAILLLIGDAIHNVADGLILGSAFLIDPSVGIATAIGLGLHEIPQEVVEFGILIQAGFSKKRAALYNFISASSIFIGLGILYAVEEHAHEYLWIITALAAGNLLFLSASDLLPRIHGNLKNYGSIWKASSLILLGFSMMTVVLVWTHETFGHGHENEMHAGEDSDHHAF